MSPDEEEQEIEVIVTELGELSPQVKAKVAAILSISVESKKAAA